MSKTCESTINAHIAGRCLLPKGHAGRHWTQLPSSIAGMHYETEWDDGFDFGHGVAYMPGGSHLQAREMVSIPSAGGG